jgi:hypothetical protein
MVSLALGWRSASSAIGWPVCRGFFVACCVALLCALAAPARSQSLAPTGCPIFHCTPEATGMIFEPLISAVATTVSNDSLGFLPAQGCSGNGTLLACIFAIDNATGAAAGTLKVIDGSTLQPDWGSAGTAGSYNLDPVTSAGGQVPVYFADGTLAAGDGYFEVHYDPTGLVLAQVPLPSPTAKNFGLTPISAQYGIVSEDNGVLTLINLVTWTRVGSLQLRDPGTHRALQLASPSTGAPNVLYAVALNSATGAGYLFSVGVNATGTALQVLSSFDFIGKSGASPVVVTPDVTGLSENLVLLNAPGLSGQTPLQNQLLGLLDPGVGSMVSAWTIPLNASLSVAPTFDPVSLTLYYALHNQPYVYQAGLLTGAPLQTFNLQQIGRFAPSFELNSHLGAIKSASSFTLLLAGGIHNKQYAMAFAPLLSPTRLQWSSELEATTILYSAAWNFAPSSQAGIVCPIALDVAGMSYSNLVRLCDF